MQIPNDALRFGFLVAITSTVLLWCGTLCTVVAAERPKYGHRGVERARALESSELFAIVEPCIRFVAGLIAPFLGGRLRERLRRELQCADDIWGLGAEELAALALISSWSLGGVTYWLVHVTGASSVSVGVATFLGLALPWIQLRQAIRERSKQITRLLPPAIEIAAMCMSAGLDFPGALRMLTARGASKDSPLAREFSVILEHLDFGHTRQHALERFAERVPSRAVREFVAAVIQAEQKGNPLARVLQVQGRMLSMRRSVAAEEAAARAGVLLIIPMVLLVGAILLLLMGPFLVKGIGF